MQAKITEYPNNQRQLNDIQAIHYGQSEEGPTINFVIGGINNIYLLSSVAAVTISESTGKEEAVCWGADEV